MTTNSVTWKWLAGSLLTILILAGGGWMRMLAADLGAVKKEQRQDREAASASREKIGVIEERTKRTEEDVREIKQDLKELLRRTPGARP